MTEPDDVARHRIGIGSSPSDWPDLHDPEPDDGFIRVRGAAQNNLREVDVDLPRDRLVAFTGVSGSGKSSLAFGTIFAEAQRRFLESVAPYARRLIAQESAPEVGSLTGVPPAVALQQRRGAPSTRSTVGTLTTVSNSVRMLYSRAGIRPAGAPMLYSDAFSPNTAAGACPRCGGQGQAHEVTEDLAVPDPGLSIREGAIAAWPGAWQGKNLRDVTAGLGIDIDVPWRDLPRSDRDFLLFTDEQPVVEVRPVRDRVEKPYRGRFWSARRHVLTTLSSSASERRRSAMLAFVESGPCRMCEGTGLTREALAVRIAGRSIAEVNATPLAELGAVLQRIADDPDAVAEDAREVAPAIAADLRARIDLLDRLGLGYLSLDRTTPTLSPGEVQRLRIATQLRSGLFGVVYVLDEPSAGLHPMDAETLWEVLTLLRRGGNSVLMVEHDMDLVRRADWVVDVGPGPGRDGGLVLHSGPVSGLSGVPESVTAQHLEQRPVPIRRPREATGVLAVRGAEANNLRAVDVDIPLGVLTAVVGVSGSGKTSLIGAAIPAAAAEATGITRVIEVDQSAIGRTPRSNLATYTGLFDAVRQAFAATPEARKRGWTAGRFSFNVAGGRCEHCQGEGAVSVELLFLPGSWSTCPVCQGSRYADETLEVTWNSASIADVLAMTVDEARDFLDEIPQAARSLTMLTEVGLGYLRLGQPAPELSGGEAQRVRLARELQRSPRGHTLYVLDEPSTGLHPADAERLLEQLQRLVDQGSSVVIAEHGMALVAQADHVIELGPGGGSQGGQIVARGTPAEVAAAGGPSARFLAARLAD